MQDYKKAVEQEKPLLIQIIKKIVSLHEVSDKSVNKIIYKNPSKSMGVFSKGTIFNAYKLLKDEVSLAPEEEKKFLSVIRMKKIRTLSGVTPVTVLTKPYYCPGNCIFCPKDTLMPKSYLSNEPGAQRALHNKFDPYLQTYNRLVAYKNIGHPTDKIELIILGGTWSSYDEKYQIWFIKRCFDAMNDFDPDKAVVIDPKEYKSEEPNVQWEQLFTAHKKNVLAKSRNVGLVVETRPDCVTEEEVIRMRKLGATKVQMGIQSLNNKVLRMNKRGHTAQETKKAFELLRRAGFKIHGHWMPNLYGSSPVKDIWDYRKLFTKSFRPDELKIYPCSLLESAELMDYYKKGLWKPYTEEELLKVLKSATLKTPRYCRITRMIRDISSDDIVVGNKKTNFRQLVDNAIKKEGKKSKDIRSREIRRKKVELSELKYKVTKFKTSVSTEYFLEYITEDDLVAGFLRLSLPKNSSFIEELGNSAIIREVHVYGQSLELGLDSKGRAQHSGIGKTLIKKSIEIAKNHHYPTLAVISAIGTREYYRKRGFTKQGLYQTMDLENLKTGLF